MITIQDYETVIKPMFVRNIWELFDIIKPVDEEAEKELRDKFNKFIESKHQILHQEPAPQPRQRVQFNFNY